MAPRPGMAHPDSATLKVLAILRAIGSVLKTCAALLTTEGAFLKGAGGPDVSASIAHPDSATLSVSAILRAIVSVLEICAALAAADATLVRGAAGAVLALAATLVLLASVGVITLASTVVLCLLAKACQPAGGLVGVTCTE